MTHTQSPEEAGAPHLAPQLLTGTEQDLKTPRHPVLVVGPSLGTSVTALWAPTLEHLQNDFIVIGWDLPGHGAQAPAETPFTMDQLADAVESMVARLAMTYGWEDEVAIHAAGVSISGVVSLTLALRPETRFRRLSMICSAARIGTPDSWDARAELVASAGTPTMVAGSAERWFAPGFLKAEPEISTNLLRSLQHADRHSYALACRALGPVDLTGRLDGIARPLLALAGEQDTVCLPSDAELVAEGSARAEAVSLPGVAHLAPAEAPKETARLLKEFLHG